MPTGARYPERGGPPGVGSILPNRLDMSYIALEMPAKSHDFAVVGRLSRYWDRLFERIEDRVEARVVERVEATLDVITDRELLRDLEAADAQPDGEARSFEEIRAARAGRA